MTEQFRMPHGLPSCIGSERAGFDALCKLLEVTTTRQKLAILNSDSVRQKLKARGTRHSRRSKTADRIQKGLTTFYRDPHVRRELWKSHMHSENAELDPTSILIPSIEYSVLTSYDQTLFNGEHSLNNLDPKSEFYDLEIVTEDWQATPIIVLPRIKEDIDKWAKLDSEQQLKVVLVAFSVSTLLDDVRLLKWASNRISDASGHFPFLYPTESISTPSVVMNDSVDRARECESEDIFKRLASATRRLSNACSLLEKSPNSEHMFDEIALYASEIESLRMPAIKAEKSRSLRVLLDDVSTLLSEESRRTPWIAEHIDDIIADWQTNLEYYGSCEEVCEDLERARREFVFHMDAWHEANEKETESRAALRDLEDTSGLDGNQTSNIRSLEYGYHEDILRFGRLADAARCKALTHVRPVLRTLGGTPNSTLPGQGIEPHGDEADDPTGLKKSQGSSLDVECNQTEETASGVDTNEEKQPEQGPAAIDGQVIEPAKEFEKSEETEKILDPPAVPSEFDRAVWTAIKKGHLGRAYHIARLNEQIENIICSPSSQLLATVALGSHLNGIGAEVVHELGHRIGTLLSNLDFGDIDSQIRDALNLLLLTAALRPTLFAPQQTGAFELMKRIELSSTLAPVYGFAETIVDHAGKLRGVQLDLEMLVGVADGESWQRRWEQHLDRITRWENNGVPNFLYPQFRRAWRHWTGKDGILGRLASLISRDDDSLIREVSNLLESAVNRPVLSHFDNWRNEIGGQTGGDPSGRAVHQLQRHWTEVIELSQQWLSTVKAKPQGSDWASEEVDKLRQDIRRYGKSAIAALREKQQASPGIILESAIARACEAIESLIETPQKESGDRVSPVLSVTDSLSGDLLFVTELPLNEQGEILLSIPEREALGLLVDDERHVDSLLSAFEVRFRSGDLHGARAVCLRMSKVGDSNARESEQLLQEELDRRSRELPQQILDMSERLYRSFNMGEVAKDEYEDLSASISEGHRLLDAGSIDQTLAAISHIGNVDNSVRVHFKACLEKTEQRLREHAESLNSREERLIRQALDEDDLISLQEYVDCLEANRPLVGVESDECETLRNFVSFVEESFLEPNITQRLKKPELLQALSDGEDLLSLKFSQLSPSQASQSSRLIESWFELAGKQGSTVEDALQIFLVRLGLVAAHSIGDYSSNGNFIAVNTVTLRNRALCPVHSFGSTAKGQYNLILNWSPTACGSIVQAVESERNGQSIVLNFDQVSMEDRLWLRQWSLKNANEFIVIDELLILYLASLPWEPLRPMFDCTLPFSCGEPYFAAAGLVPPECFYGRENERRSIMDPYGSCFVYGGRQLGKTALLRSAEAAFHRPENRQIAHCIDLQKHAIGTAQSAEHLWTVLWSEFSSLGLISVEGTNRRGREKLVRDFSDRLLSWLSDDKNGRILLLLDEADEFLNEDSKGEFRESRELKGLMDQTERRFKVVLCGLHNVLRNTERANHPLAHFGEPICVGPLLGNGEHEQARALIREPLATAGYSFDNDSLITNILVWTNYYPSLIQLFGGALLDYLRQTANSEIPRSVSRNDIEAVFAADGFRDYIWQRFALTLQLDQRYEVIAYALAYELYGDPTGTSQGVTLSEAMLLAQDAWPEGFELSRREFDTLLREMCGLGILRRRQVDQDTVRYTFRNPNVQLLFGNDETIFEALNKSRELPEEFEPATYHAQYPQETSARERRGPLTFEQEGLLKHGGRIAVLCGTNIANLDRCQEFLSQRLDRGLLRSIEPCLDAQQLRRKLSVLRPGRFAYVCMVGSDDPWSLHWIDTIATLLPAGKVGSGLRVVFCADGDRLWDLVMELPFELLSEQPNDKLDWVGLQPWNRAFLRRWCIDENFQQADLDLDELLEITGGWPRLLEHYAQSDQLGWNQRRTELIDYIEANREQLFMDVGLASLDAKNQMGAIRELDEFTLDDVDEYSTILSDEGVTSFAPGTLRRRLIWAIHLGLVQDVGGSWRLNSLVDRLLADSPQ